MPKIDGIYLATLVKMRLWTRIWQTKPTLKEIIEMTKKENT